MTSEDVQIDLSYEVRKFLDARFELYQEAAKTVIRAVQDYVDEEGADGLSDFAHEVVMDVARIIKRDIYGSEPGKLLGIVKDIYQRLYHETEEYNILNQDEIPEFNFHVMGRNAAGERMDINLEDPAEWSRAMLVCVPNPDYPHEENSPSL